MKICIKCKKRKNNLSFWKYKTCMGCRDKAKEAYKIKNKK